MTDSNKRKKTSWFMIALLLLALITPPFGIVFAIIPIFILIKNRKSLNEFNISFSSLQIAIMLILLILGIVCFYRFTVIPVTKERAEREKIYTIRCDPNTICRDILYKDQSFTGLIPGK